MKDIVKIIKKLNTFEFSTGVLILFIVLIRLPNLQLSFILSSISSHALMRIFSIILVVGLLIFQRNSLQFKKWVKIVIFAYFCALSLTVVTAQNVSSFINTYKDVIGGFGLFLCFYAFSSKRNIKHIALTFTGISVLILMFEVLLYLIPTITIPLFTALYNPNYLQFFLFQTNRGRFFGDSLNEAFIPLFYIFLLKQERFTLKKGIALFSIILITVFFTVFVSNWRTKAIIFIFSTVLSFFIFTHIHKKHLLIYLFIGFIIAVNTFSMISQVIGGKNILSRFTTQIDEYGSDSNLTRIRYWQDSIDIGNSSPLFGVGIGNYFDSLTQNAKSKNMNDSNSYSERSILIDDPHNLFFSAYANTGFLGLSALLALTAYFLFTDVAKFYKYEIVLKGFILVFWSIYIYTLFNPWMYFQFFGLFWIIRGIVEKHKYLLDIHEK